MKLETPICNFSKKPCSLLCLNQTCEIYPFICEDCRENDCTNLHIHKKLFQTTDWKSFQPISYRINSKIKHDALKFNQQYKKRLQVGMKKLEQVIENYFPVIVENFLELNVKLRAQEATRRLIDNKFHLVSGKDLRMLQQICENKDYKIHKKYIEREIKQKKNKLIDSFKQTIKNQIQYNLIPKKISQEQSEQYLLDKLNKQIFYGPSDQTTFYKRGKLLHKLNRISEAEIDINRAIQLNPNYLDAYNFRGILYKATNKFKQAQLDYTKVIQMNPQDPAAYNNRGVLYKYTNQLKLALSDFNKAIQLNPIDPLLYENRALLNRKLHNYKEAELDQIKVLQLKMQHTTDNINKHKY